MTVAVIARAYLQTCLDCLDQAGLQATRMIPDWLALPYQEGETTAIQLENEWLFREGTCQGFTVDQECLPALRLIKEEQEHADDKEKKATYSTHVDHADLKGLNQCIRSFSAPPEDATPFLWKADRFTPALILLVKGCLDAKITLLTGAYRQNKKTQIPLWKGVQAACIALLCFVILSFMEKGLILYRLTKEAEQTKKKVEEAYQSLFSTPQKVVNPGAQFKALKNEMKAQPKASHLMNFFSRFAIAIADMKMTPQKIQLFALRYERNPHALYLQIGMDDFSGFEQLRNRLSEYFTVEQGVLVQEKKRVRGTLTLKEKIKKIIHLKTNR